MKLILNTVTFLLIIGVLASCSTTNTRVPTQARQKPPRQMKAPQKPSGKTVKEKPAVAPKRKADTVITRKETVEKGKQEITTKSEVKTKTEPKQPVPETPVPSLSSQFDEAVDLFEKEKFDECCIKFEALSQTLDKRDSLYYETLFFVCECNLINENFDEAEMKLIKMHNDKITPRAVYEKVLVRLGQIYCYKNDIKTAKKYFQKFKKEFPDSIYLPFANCDFVR